MLVGFGLCAQHTAPSSKRTAIMFCFRAKILLNFHHACAGRVRAGGACRGSSSAAAHRCHLVLPNGMAPHSKNACISNGIASDHVNCAARTMRVHDGRADVIASLQVDHFNFETPKQSFMQKVLIYDAAYKTGFVVDCCCRSVISSSSALRCYHPVISLSVPSYTQATS